MYKKMQLFLHFFQPQTLTLCMPRRYLSNFFLPQNCFFVPFYKFIPKFAEIFGNNKQYLFII